MSGPTGFVQRVKGKVSWGPQNPLKHGVEYVTSTAAGGNYPLYPSGLSIINSSTGAAYFTLGPPQVGTIKSIVISTASSGLTIRTNSTGAGGVYFDSTSFTMIHPSTGITAIQSYHFLAASSVLWVSWGANPNSTIILSTAIGTSS